MADLAIAQLHDMREHAEMIANLDPYGPPLIADMDTGYGGKFRRLHPFKHLITAISKNPNSFLPTLSSVPSSNKQS